MDFLVKILLQRNIYFHYYGLMLDEELFHIYVHMEPYHHNRIRCQYIHLVRNKRSFYNIFFLEAIEMRNSVIHYNCLIIMRCSHYKVWLLRPNNISFCFYCHISSTPLLFLYKSNFPWFVKSSFKSKNIIKIHIYSF